MSGMVPEVSQKCNEQHARKLPDLLAISQPIAEDGYIKAEPVMSMRTRSIFSPHVYPSKHNASISACTVLTLHGLMHPKCCNCQAPTGDMLQIHHLGSPDHD